MSWFGSSQSQNPNGYTNYPPQAYQTQPMSTAWNPSLNIPQNAASWLAGTMTRDIAPFRVNDKYPNGMKPGQIIKHKEKYYLIQAVEEISLLMNGDVVRISSNNELTHNLEGQILRTESDQNEKYYAYVSITKGNERYHVGQEVVFPSSVLNLIEPSSAHKKLLKGPDLVKITSTIHGTGVDKHGTFLNYNGLKAKVTPITKEHASELKTWFTRLQKDNSSGRYNRHISTIDNILSSFEEKVELEVHTKEEQKESEEWLNTFVNELKSRLLEAE